MVNERLQADMATMLEGLDEQLRGIAEIQRRRSVLTATVTACEQRIQVTVNADGLLIDTKFADDIGELSYDEIAAAMTGAVQTAAAEVLRRGRELMEPLLERKTRLPKLSDIIEGAPDLGAMIPVAPPPPTRPAPDSNGSGRPGSSDGSFSDGSTARSPIADQDW